MEHVKSSMPGMKATIASLSEEADAIESATDAARASSRGHLQASKIDIDRGVHF